VKKEEEVYGADETIYKDRFAKAATNCLLGSEGMPIGIQVMGLPFEDEKVVEVMRMIDSENQFYKKYQGPKNYI